MKKSTKRLVSMILATSMLFTSVMTASVPVSAAEYKAGDLPGFAFTKTEADGQSVSTWDFSGAQATTPEDTKIKGGDVLEGLAVTDSTGKGSKTWSSSNMLALSIGMGFDLPISEGCTGGTIAITGNGKSVHDDPAKLDERTLTMNGKTDIDYSKEEQVIEFTADDVKGGVLTFVNTSHTEGKSTQDYKVKKIVLTEKLGAVSDTTVITTEESTKTPDNDTTKEPDTEATTKEPDTVATTKEPGTETTTAGSVEEYKGLENNILKDAAVGSVFTGSADGQITLGDASGWTVKVSDTATEEIKLFDDATQKVTTGTGRFYSTKVQGGNNPDPAYKADNALAVPTSGSYLKVVPTEKAKLMMDIKVGSGKQYAVVSVDDKTGDKVQVDFINNQTTDDILIYREYNVEPGKTYYVTSGGSKTTFFAIVLEPEKQAANGLEGNIIGTEVGAVVTGTADGQIKISDEGGWAVKANDTAKDEIMYFDDATQKVTTGTGRFYETKIQGGTNPDPAYKSDNLLAVPTAGSFLTVKPTEKAKLAMDIKIGSGKQYAVISVDDKTGDKVQLDFINNQGTDDLLIYREYNVEPGKTYYVTSGGSKTTFFAIALQSEGGSVTEKGDVNVEVSVDGVEAQDGVYELTKTDRSFVASIDVTGKEYNNYTFDLSYDPSVIVPTAVVEAASPFDGYSTYKTSDGTVYPAYDVNAVNAAIKDTAATGKVRLANTFRSEADKALLTAGEGTLVKIEFAIVGEGTSPIEVTKVEDGFWADPDQNTALTVGITNAKVNVTDAIVIPAGTIGVIVEPSGDPIDAKEGDSIVLNFKTQGVTKDAEKPENNAQFNNYSFIITYDPEVLEAVEAAAADDSFTSDLQTNIVAPGVIRVAGKLGNVDGDPTKLVLAEKDGTLVAFKFNVLSKGNAKVDVEPIDALFYGDNYDPVQYKLAIGDVIIGKALEIPEIIGDIDMSALTATDPVAKEQPWTAFDSAMLLQWVLDPTQTTECEKVYPDTWYYIADVNADNKITAEDAEFIQTKVLDDTIEFPIAAKAESGEYDYDLTVQNMSGTAAQQ